MPSAGDSILASTITGILTPGHIDWVSSLAWTGSVSNPAFGNAVTAAEYRRESSDADLISFFIEITMGSTTTYGSGVWFLSLPVAAHSTWVGRPCGMVYAQDTGTTNYGGIMVVESTTTARMVLSGSYASNYPMTWVSTDVLSINGSYRPA